MDALDPISTGIAKPREAAIRKAAEALEAAFLSEMLKGAGLGESQNTFGGGIGESQFQSFLRDEQAAQMQAAGGIGLAEQLVRSMTGRTDG